MIITMTGKPCSGKSALIFYLMDKYGFTRFSGGDIYRRVASERGIDVLELNRINDVTVDKLVDEEIVRIGERDLEKDIIFDSRTAWYFIPKSFKVFVDIQGEEQISRLLGSNRTTENINLTREEARKNLDERWELENKRYQTLYGFDNKSPDNYDFVIDTTDLSIEEAGEKVYEKYQEFLKNRK